MAVKAILFDLDNTLIDFMTFKKNSVSAALDAMIKAGLNIDKRKATEILFKIYYETGIEDPKIFQKFLKKVEGKINYKYLAYGILAYRKMKESHMTPYPGTIETLEKLRKKYKLAVVSDAPGINAWLRLISMKIDGFFDVVLTKSDVKNTKKSEIPFRAALNALKVRPSEALMVGDWIERDIIGAKKIGIKTCYARYGDEESGIERGKSGADFEIDNIKEILELNID